jgi:hypothetical protein
METVEQVSLATRHQVKEGRRITLNVDHTHCLPDFNIHDNYLQGRDGSTPQQVKPHNQRL